MPLPFDLVNSVGPSWGWLLFFVWGAYQLYWPFSTTKIQQFHDDFTSRMQRIEITQVALAEDADTVDSEKVKEMHGKDSLSVADIKE